MIAIIDYGMGNLRSVQKALEKVGATATFVTEPAALRDAPAAVLPGVGAFRDAISVLDRLGFSEAIREHVAAKKPLLGICLGLQLLMSASEEDGDYRGLDLVPGRCVRFTSQPGLKIPHMGWNTVTPTPQAASSSSLEGVAAGSHVYFVHSYHVVPEDPTAVALTSDHGGPFVAAIESGPIFATQFHPEKSQGVGQQLLRNFAERAGASVAAAEPAVST